MLQAPLTAGTSLGACLERNTKDMLVGSAHTLGISTSGKKGEIIARLADYLLDSEFLQQTLVKNLEERELEALRWLLASTGMRPWKEFVHKFGDDEEESVYWDYHEPDSIPGRLRRTGIFYTGTCEGQQAAYIPIDVCQILNRLLSPSH